MIAEIKYGESLSANAYNGAGSNYVVEANNGAIYHIYVDCLSDIVWKKSTDGGLTWTSPISIYAATTTQLALWYGRWSDRTDDLIYMAYSDSAADDILFRTLNTATDTLGTQTVVFAGVSTAAGGTLSITVAKGGNIVVAGYIDAGAEGGTFKSTDGGATWAAAIANAMEAVTQDQILLAPDYNADTQDVCMFFWDASANEISVKRYDNSANTWTETSISTGMVDVAAATSYPHFAFVPDIANSRNILIAWNSIDVAGQDLLCWQVTNTTITAMTDVVANATDDCHLAALSIDTDNGRLYAFWGGNPNGSETVFTSLHIYYKYSDDGGTTWSAAQRLTKNLQRLKSLWAAPRAGNVPEHWHLAFINQTVANVVEYYTLKTVFTATTGQTIIS